MFIFLTKINKFSYAFACTHAHKLIMLKVNINLKPVTNHDYVSSIVGKQHHMNFKFESNSNPRSLPPPEEEEEKAFLSKLDDRH